MKINLNEGKIYEYSRKIIDKNPIIDTVAIMMKTFTCQINAS